MPVAVEAETRTLLVPNGSFESPATDFVNIQVDGWRKTPRPDDYPEGGGFLWDQLTGVFRNTPPDSPDHLLNIDGKQALYLFAIPGVGLFQDATDTDTPDASTNPTVSHRFETVRSDDVGQVSLAPYLQNQIRWTDRIRTESGIRLDHQRFENRPQDQPRGDSAQETLLSPKSQTNGISARLHVPGFYRTTSESIF